jgi:hypothetical protein
MKEAIFIIFTLLITGCSPTTYEECVFENVRDANSDRGASIANAVCRKKFPK